MELARRRVTRGYGTDRVGVDESRAEELSLLESGHLPDYSSRLEDGRDGRGSDVGLEPVDPERHAGNHNEGRRQLT